MVEDKFFEVGSVVKHKLTQERLLVLNSSGFGWTGGPTRVRLRTEKLEEIFLDEDELEKIIKK